MESWQLIAPDIRAAQGGDRTGFDRLAERYARPLKAVLRAEAGKRLRERYEIEDLLQETFLRAFRAIGGFRGEGEPSFRRWFVCLARHVALDHARKVRSQKGDARREVPLGRKVLAGDGELYHLESLLEADASSPSQALRREERFDRLKRALESLQPDHARVIVLARLRGLPVKEVARLMERSPEAVSMLLLRALQKLKAGFGMTESFRLPADRSLEDEGGR